jgi:hypothetical protein
LGALPNHVVARAAVPDAGARPFSARPPQLRATRLAVVPSSPLATLGIWGVIRGIGTWAAPRQLVCSSRGDTPAVNAPFLLIMDLSVGP